MAKKTKSKRTKKKTRARGSSGGITIPSQRQCAISDLSAESIRALIEDLSDEPELNIVGLQVKKGTAGAFRLVVRLERQV